MKKINHILVQIGILILLLSATVSHATATPARDGRHPVRLEHATAVQPTVITKNVTGITATSATTGGNVLSDGGDPVTVRGVCWSTSPNPTLADSHTVDGSGTGPFSSSLEGLTPQQTYYVRAYATNSEGTAYGSELQFTTPCAAIVTWDTVVISPLEMPYDYADTSLQVGTPDSSTFLFRYENASNGCDSLSYVLFVYRANYIRACEQYHWAVDGHTYTESGRYFHYRIDDLGEEACDTLVLILVTPSVTIEPFAPVYICLGQDTVIAATASATGPVSYSWDGPGIFSNLDSLVTIINASLIDTGLYTVTATTAIGSCTATATQSVHVTVVVSSSLEITGNKPVCPGESDTLTAYGSESYLWENAVNSPTFIVSPLTSTTYHVVATDVYGCMSTAEVHVKVNPLPDIFVIGNAEICVGDTVELEAVGASTYIWDSGDTTATFKAAPPADTVYYVIGTDINSCQNITSVAVTVHNLPEVTVIGDSSICGGQETELVAVGAVTYVWDDESIGSSLTVNPDSTTSYSVTGTDENGCSNSASFTVQVGEGNAYDVFVTACDSFYWPESDETYTETGTYPFLFTNQEGCVDTLILHLTINQNDTIRVRVSECDSYTWPVNDQTYTESVIDTFEYISPGGCGTTMILYLTIKKGTHVIDTSLACHEHLWPVTGEVYTQSGDYVFDYIGSNGCPCTRTLHLDIYSPEVTLRPMEPVTACPGEDITFSASATGTGPVFYLWSCSSNSFSDSGSTVTIPQATPTATGFYTVTAYTTLGLCSTWDVDSVLVTVPSPVEVTVDGDTTVCAGDSVTLTAHGAVTYRWSNGVTAPSITVSPSLSTLYAVTGTDSLGCTGYAVVGVTVKPKPVVAITGDQDVCVGKNTTVTATGASTYVWSDGTTGQSITLTPNDSSIYYVTGTNIQGCSAIDSIQFFVHPNPSVGILGGEPVCEGESVSLSAHGATSYVWSNGSNGASISPSPTSSTTYAVTGYSEYGCTGTASKHVTIHPRPNISISKNDPVCAGEDVILTASGASSYDWGLGLMGSTLTVSPGSSTTYSVIGTSSHGCSAIAEVFVRVNPRPNLFIIGPGGVCKGESIELGVTGASNYSWSNGSGSSTISVSPTESTVYSVTGTDENFCQNTTSIAVTVRELPVVVILGDDTICEDGVTLLNAVGAFTYVWNDGETAPSRFESPGSTTSYSVTGTDRYGCSNDTTITVVVGQGSEYEESYTACDTFYWYFSQETYTASGIYPFSRVNEYGCVDTRILNLTIRERDTVITSTTACDSYEWELNGQTYTESVMDTCTFLNSHGCESVGLLFLTINKGTHQFDTVPETEEEHVCDYYLWPVNGQVYTESGDYVFEYTGGNGCPSTITLHLDLKESSHEEVEAMGLNKYTWDVTGETYYNSGNYEARLINKDGCDSIITLHLTIEHSPDTCIYVTVKDVSCESGHDGQVSVIIPASIRDKCTVEWTLPDNTIRIEETLTGMPKGLYTVKVRSSLCQNVILFKETVVVKNPCGVNATITGPREVTYSACDGLPRVTFYASVTGGTPPYTIPGWNVNGSSASQTITLSGTHSIYCHVIDAEGDFGDAKPYKVFAKKIECARDPNEIKGPSGYSEEERFVNVTDKMNYTISFENDPDFAMAPASRVKITYDVPDEQRLASFRLTDFGFGDFMFTAPSNAASYSQRLDVSDSLGVWVDVNAGIDVVHRQLFWIFQSIDPATGAEPASSQMGFLSINDSLGHGEGYVSFYMIPESGLHTGDTVAAEAIIVFDDNAPIGTNVWRNTFDAVAPTSTLHAELNEQDSLYCTFTFSAQDDAGGSGVQSVEVYMSVNNGAYTSIGSSPPDSTLTYAMENGLNYRFVSAATDNVGNTEPLKTRPDTTINFNTPPIDLVLDGNIFYENVPINTYIGSFITIDNDINQQFTYELVSGAGSADNGLFQIVHNELRTNALFECSNRTEYAIRVRTTDIGGLSLEKEFIVNEVILHQTPVTYQQASICQGESYEWNGMTLTTDGTYSVTLAKNDGCDSVVTLFLTMNPVYRTVITETVCEGGSYNFFGQNYTQTGSYSDTLNSVYGCDSIFTLNLIVNPASATSLSATACNSYVLNNTTYTQSGVYKQYLSNHYGCDSVITLNLTIFHSDSTEFTETACDSYVWNNQTYTQSGDYTQTLTNTAGCDSTVTLHLTILNSTYYVDTETACDTYTWIDGNVYTESNNTATYTLTNASGCDSVITLDLTVSHSTTGVDVQTACDTYTWIDGNTYTESNNTATYTLTNAVGCDSVVTLNLTVNHNTTGVDVQTACDAYTWIDGNTYTESNNTATYTLTNAAGCDSVVTLNLTINHSNTGVDVQTACDTYTWIDGNAYTESNSTATHTLTNAAGCDSVVTLNLTVNYSTHNVETVFACESYTWHGQTYTTSGTYEYEYTNASDCPSVDTLHLTINHSTYNVVTETACESFTWHGQAYTESGTYIYDYTNVGGCVCADTLHLTILSTVAEQVEATACDSYMWNGTTYTVSGDYYQTFTAANGCDSTVTLHLTVNYSTVSDFSITTADSCYEWNMVRYCENGDYVQTLQTTDGCDSVVTLHLTITVDIDDHDLSGIEVFPNPTNSILNIKGEDMRQILIYDDEGKLVYASNELSSSLETVDVTRYAAGQYFVKIILGNKQTVTKKVIVSRK